MRPEKYIVIPLKSAMHEVASRRTEPGEADCVPSRLDGNRFVSFLKKPAEAGEWAGVRRLRIRPGPDPANAAGQTARTAFRAGFLGPDVHWAVRRWRRSSRRAKRIAAPLSKCLQRSSSRISAPPDFAIARRAADEEIDFAVSLCGHSPGCTRRRSPASLRTGPSARNSGRCARARQPGHTPRIRIFRGGWRGRCSR